MSEIGLEIFIILFLILINGIFAMSEIAIVSSRKARLQQLVNEGDEKAKIALELANNPSNFLSTVQVGITLVGVLAGAVGGATIVEFLAPQLARLSWLAPYSETISLVLVVMTITYFSITLGELAPKRFALQNPERIASTVAGPMRSLSKLFSPIVRLLGASTSLVMRLLGAKPSSEPPVTEEEIHVLLNQGTQAGVFEEAELDMVAGVFSLNDRRVYSLMTPRTEILWLDVRDTAEEILKKLAEGPYSRFPVCQGSLDNVLGIVKARELLTRSLAGEPIHLKECLSPALFIPETTFASRALEVFKESNKELILVIDEFGGVTGLLTINDVLEEIVGDIEVGEPQVTQRQDGSWLLDGMLDIDEFKELFHLGTLPNEDDYETLAGFVLTSLGKIPQSADQFEWEGLRFEVVDMDARRVDKVLVTTLPARPVAN
ncbi:MAG: HlyC/CorC family transporter [Anaerolineales bacterium]|nr:HlyC/CorC family transporter [Anaerolineales bacterium]